MSMNLAVFRADVTPPVDSPLCGGWLGIARGIADPLYANGVVLSGCGAPIVLCAVDWCEISNGGYTQWCEALAAAAGTSPDRVAVHCIHAHLSPWMDSGAQDRVEAEGGKLRDIYDRAWAEAALASTAASLKAALLSAQPLTHLKVGRAKVEKIASNRRIMGDDGRVKAVRWTTTRDAAVRAEPEGVVDPDIKTISFWNGDAKLAVLHYYAVHPSSYEDLWVSPDFVGLARDRRAQEDGRVPHLYFTECAGDITAGKYNDGDRRNRELFAQRMLLAMTESERETRTVPVDKVEWRSIPLNLPPRDDTTIAQLQQRIADTTRTHKDRQRDAMELSYAERWHRPIMINALHIDDSVCIVQLPGEPFIAYQLLAQRLRPDAFVAVPAYGDCSPGYICVDGSFEEGGYEPVDAFVTAAAEPLMTEAITRAVARA